MSCASFKDSDRAISIIIVGGGSCEHSIVRGIIDLGGIVIRDSSNGRTIAPVRIVAGACAISVVCGRSGRSECSVGILDSRFDPGKEGGVCYARITRAVIIIGGGGV